MNFIVIKGSIDQTRRELLSTKRLVEELVFSNKREEYKSQLNSLNRKLDALSRYEVMESKKTEYEKILKSLHKSKKGYTEACKELCKDIKGISFSKRDKVFVVRTRINGRLVYGGVLDHFNDAVDILESLKK